MPNYNIFVSSALSTSETPSTIIRYDSFALAQSDTVLWTPSSGKNIYLTSIQMSTLITQTVTLSGSNNGIFLVTRFNGTIAAISYSSNFFSPIKFDTNENISITSNGVGTLDITLLGYEQ
ncbi:hypothetical protein [Wukongibacter sp. M2B1]|uniref:hypothetical protein n=1 Tax=Wukongibacter sp. M2B1 TaxID=3088895 RepID=UPI003D7B796C